MPTVLKILGWRFFFYANENNEPIHIHAIKGNCECKYWLDVEKYDIKEAFSYSLTIRDRREVRKIIFEHFDYIVKKWQAFQRRKRD